MLTSRKTYDIIAKHYANGGIAQRLEHPVHTRQVIGSNPISATITGPLVKRLRHGPFTAVTWVRFPYGSPAKQKGHSQECPFCFADNPYGLRTHLQNIFVLDWGRIVCPVVPCRNLARQGIFPYKFLIALLSKNLLVRTRLIKESGSHFRPRPMSARSQEARQK